MKCVERQTELRNVDFEEESEGLVRMRMQVGNTSSLYPSSLINFVTTAYYFHK